MLQTLQKAAVSAVPVLSSAHQGTLDALFPHGRGRRVYLNTMFWALKISPDYNIWLEWNYSRLTNKGFFMAPQTQKGGTYRVFSPNGYHAEVSAEAMGIICCLFTYSHLSYQSWFQPLASDHFHLLREYAGTRSDADCILAAIA
jgi:hypothetical protein